MTEPAGDGIAFVDTNIFVYAYDRKAGAKHDQAQALVADLSERQTLRLSAQVLNELAAVLLRGRSGTPLSPAQVLQIVEEGEALADRHTLDQRILVFSDAGNRS